MITLNDIVEIGDFNKPHGISGEISASFLCDTEDIEAFSCLIVSQDGIFVPFFVENARQKNDHTSLIKFDGIDSDKEVKQFTGKKIYVLKSEVSEEDDEYQDAYSFIGYSIVDDKGTLIGEIADIEDSTDNYLFIVKQNERELFIPIADEFITGINDETKTLSMILPQGLLDM